MPRILRAVSLAPDLLRGAEQIAAFLYGSAAEKRKVYHLAETTRLPVFRLGALLCARRSVLLACGGAGAAGHAGSGCETARLTAGARAAAAERAGR